jgi:hypothetical protein
MVEILCQLSRDHGVDWEFHHDYDPGPIGFIRRGVCEPRLLDQVEAFADLGDILGDLTAGSEDGVDGGDDEEEDEGGGPRILPFQPRDR